MKAAVFREINQPMEIEEVQLSKPGPREVLIRTSPLRPGAWLFFLVTCFCLALSATYELIEWQVAVWTGTAADAFLGTQGDVWDTQKDMALALVGAILAQTLLARRHDRALAAAEGRRQPA